MTATVFDPDPASFRDPGGRVFRHEGRVYRQINKPSQAAYTQLMSSGLYQALTTAGWLIPHETCDLECPEPRVGVEVIRPTNIPFISYPYEWSFSQLKAAALTTLATQLTALAHGMSLKDASSYNIQFLQGKAVLIDTLSFESYVEGRPWVAYRQFCQHFFAPLALMSQKDIRLNQLLRIYIDGIPLDLASALLPIRSVLSLSALIHVHAHAKFQKSYAEGGGGKSAKNGKMSKAALLGLINGLSSAIQDMKWKPSGTEWSDYYDNTNYSDQTFEQKKSLVDEMLLSADPKSVWDMGANLGVFSRIASARGIPTVSMDIDPAAVEKNYLMCVAGKEKNLLPLLIDLTNPSSAIGWNNQERASLIQRGPVDAILALALIHHLAISNNLPFKEIAEFFSAICRHLIIEFVPKEDSQVRRLLSSREDIFDRYTEEDFKEEFGRCFYFKRSASIPGTLRTLHLLQKL